MFYTSSPRLFFAITLWDGQHFYLLFSNQINLLKGLQLVGKGANFIQCFSATGSKVSRGMRKEKWVLDLKS